MKNRTTDQLKLLVVEDNPGDAFLIRQNITDASEADVDIVCVDIFSEAVRYLNENSVDVVLLDLGLPDSSGVDTVIRFREAFPWLPVVVLTGNDDSEAGLAAVKAGAQDYLVKGRFSEDLLVRVVRYAIERHQTEVVLRESEKFLRTTLDALSAKIAIIDDSGCILSVNRSWRQLSETSKCPLCNAGEGADYLDACQYAEKKGVSEAKGFTAGLRSVMSGESDFFETEHLCPGLSEKRWFQVRVTPFPGGGPAKVVVSQEDITARMEAVEKLEASEARFRTIFETSPNCVFIKDRNGRYLMANKAIGRLYELAPEKMIGRTDLELFDAQAMDGQEARRFMADDELVIQKGETVVVAEERITRKDGTVRWFSTIKTPISFPENPDCMLGIALDVTEQNRAKEELRNSELRLRTILDAHTSKVVHVDTDLNVLWPNRAACDSAGMDRNEIIGRPCHEIWQSRWETCKDCPVLEAINKGSHQVCLRKTSDKRTWRVLGCPVRDEAGRITSAVEISEDITERLAMEDQLRQAQKMEAIGALAGGIAHDFNNILSSIIGFTQLALDETPKDTMLADNLQEVYAAGKRAKDLVKQILTFARKSEEKLHPIQIKQAAKESLKFMRSFIPTSVEIRQRLDSEAMVMGNPIQFQQIFMNLCTNAVQAMEDGTGVLDVVLEDITFEKTSESSGFGLKPGRYIALKIADTGTGINPDMIPSIFEPYFTTKEYGEGTGMGLAVVHGIVESYGGKIDVKSQPGSGTVFTIYLPVEAEPSNKTFFYESEEALPSGREHILFVDDEPMIIRMACKFLQSMDYKVTTRTSSIAALELFRSTPDEFDLVITDMTMPNITGAKLADEIMKIRPDASVILCTGFHRKIEGRTAVDFGVKAVVKKPFDRAELAKTIRNVLDKAKVDNRG